MLLENRQRKTWNKSATYWARASKHASEEWEENLGAISVCFCRIKRASRICYIWCLKQNQWGKIFVESQYLETWQNLGMNHVSNYPSIPGLAQLHIYTAKIKNAKKPWRHLEAFISPCKYRHSCENWKMIFMIISAEYPKITLYYQ